MRRDFGIILIITLTILTSSFQPVAEASSGGRMSSSVRGVSHSKSETNNHHSYKEPRKSYISKIQEEKKTNEPPLHEDDDSNNNHVKKKHAVVLIRPEDQDDVYYPHKGRSISARAAKSGNNWYVYKPDNSFGRAIEGPDGGSGGGEPGNTSGGMNKLKPGGGSGMAGGGTGGTGLGGGGMNGTGKGGRQKGPYGVRRAKPKDIIDPSGYNFFQFQPNQKVGFLWISGNGSADGSRTDEIGSDEGPDEDDLDPANLYDWEFRRYDRACLYVEYKKAKEKAALEVAEIPVEARRLIENQNQLLARRFLNWTFEQEENETSLEPPGGDAPGNTSYTFLFLQETRNIFMNKICKKASSYAFASAATASSGAAASAMEHSELGNATNFLPENFVSYLYRLFLVLRDITVPKNAPEYPTEEDKVMIIDEILKNCSESEDPIHWFTHSCGDQVLSYDQKNHFACTPNSDYDFNTKVYDPVLDAVWHMFNAVHAYCFKHFQKNIRMWHRYSLIMANAFSKQMRQRWKAAAATEKFYMRLLGPEHPVYLETINRCMYGAVLRTDTPILLPRFDTPSPLTFAPMKVMLGPNSTASG